MTFAFDFFSIHINPFDFIQLLKSIAKDRKNRSEKFFPKKQEKLQRSIQQITPNKKHANFSLKPNTQPLPYYFNLDLFICYVKKK